MAEGGHRESIGLIVVACPVGMVGLPPYSRPVRDSDLRFVLHERVHLVKFLGTGRLLECRQAIVSLTRKELVFDATSNRGISCG